MKSYWVLPPPPKKKPNTNHEIHNHVVLRSQRATPNGQHRHQLQTLCCGSGSVESVSIPLIWIRKIRINSLDPDPYQFPGSGSIYKIGWIRILTKSWLDPDTTKTIEKQKISLFF